MTSFAIHLSPGRVDTGGEERGGKQFGDISSPLFDERRPN